MKLFNKFLVLCFLPIIGHAQYTQNDWKERDTWMPIETLFELANIKEGSQVADIGCHEGYLSIHLANNVGANGRVYAVDVREDRLDRLKEHLESRNLNNVAVIVGDYDNPKLPNETLDVVFIVDTYHEMTDYKVILNHVYKALKPNGKLVILEKLKSRVKNATRREQTNAHTLGPKYVKQEMKDANFSIVKQINDLGHWQNDEDKIMWLLVAKKSN
ncbi:methyltransferase domain-containing protein [Flavobacteriaceae bacterium S0825]|uniref:class I SAM-dependent methyltransferase n=1 Tax=Gaetbulibacter sp. S0825 TaxID=2720084 RepID=UPI001431A41D|nr:methyltransferase domain-containing protein [Gaetbulibacter sp. S0825]MCK0109747.1 methyltransferase domain-containing protein [Flavobacteriaceae bacterium S0825]NIX65379.1 methyltransferase domain-containing protein [Gaetbulibacter sp. S0825]